MTVSTVPHPSSTPSAQGSQHRNFSSTERDEASQYQTPKSSNYSQESSYVLTLHTDSNHSKSMTKLRTIYFPPKLNRLDAHLTLFHALPGQKLESDVIPAIQDMVSKTSNYHVRATGPFRLKYGVGINVEDDIYNAKVGKQGRGRNMSRIIHANLRRQWSEFLSEQDSKPVNIHYTVMNKVEDESVIKAAIEELKERFAKEQDGSSGETGHKDATPANEETNAKDDKAEKLVCEGEIKGVTLWKYFKGRWIEPRHFDFAPHAGSRKISEFPSS